MGRKCGFICPFCSIGRMNVRKDGAGGEIKLCQWGIFLFRHNRRGSFV